MFPTVISEGVLYQEAPVFPRFINGTSIRETVIMITLPLADRGTVPLTSHFHPYSNMIDGLYL